MRNSGGLCERSLVSSPSVQTTACQTTQRKIRDCRWLVPHCEATPISEQLRQFSCCERAQRKNSRYMLGSEPTCSDAASGLQRYGTWSPPPYDDSQPKGEIHIRRKARCAVGVKDLGHIPESSYSAGGGYLRRSLNGPSNGRPHPAYFVVFSFDRSNMAAVEGTPSIIVLIFGSALPNCRTIKP